MVDDPRDDVDLEKLIEAVADLVNELIRAVTSIDVSNI